jgi:hypothetical protein
LHRIALSSADTQTIKSESRISASHASGSLGGESMRSMSYSAMALVHDVCLEATKKYLAEHVRTYQARNHSAQQQPGFCRRHRRHRHAHRFSPYSPGRNEVDDDKMFGMAAPARAIHIPEPTNSLPKNVSFICDLMWRRAQRDRADIPRAERMAAESMACLLDWAETVVFAEANDRRGPAEDNILRRTAVAAQNICAWLDDAEGLAFLESL